ncbi:MAG: nitroreductase family protein [Candidatus Bathyarchaeia archaeon]
MDVLEAIKNRRSTRNYEPTPIPKDKLVRILEAARVAPSASNRQPWHFIVVTDAEKRKVLSHGMFAKFLTSVPVVIVACGDTKTSPEWYAVDVSLAMENMALAATGLDLATCFIGSFDEATVKKAVGVPERLSVVAMLALGYSKEKEGVAGQLIRLVQRRKTLEEIVSLEEYGRKYDPEQIH